MANLNISDINLSNIDFTKVKKEYLIAACLIFLLLIVFFSYRSVLSPLLSEIRHISTEMERRTIDIQRARIAPQDLSSLEEEIARIREQADIYQSQLEGVRDVPQILKEFNSIAEALKVTIVSVDPLSSEEIALPAGDQILLQAPIKIKMRCGYHQLGMFINQIENSPNFMKITNVKLSANSSNIWLHNAEMVITSFRLISAAEKGL